MNMINNPLLITHHIQRVLVQQINDQGPVA